MKILVVEDSERLLRSLGDGLTRAGHVVDLAADGAEGLSYAESYQYDVIVLDLMLPLIDGLEVLRRIRAQDNNVHVLILSAKDRVENRIEGLNLGADDYLTKPFHFGELRARLEALVRRLAERKNPTYQIGGLVIDSALRMVSRDGERIDLTRSEYALLEVLARRPNQVFSRDRLRDSLYTSETDVSTNMIEVLVSSLRRKIGKASPIVTRRGHGYFFDSSLA